MRNVVKFGNLCFTSLNYYNLVEATKNFYWTKDEGTVDPPYSNPMVQEILLALQDLVMVK